MSALASTGTILGLVPYVGIKDDNGGTFDGLTVWYVLDGESEDPDSVGMVPLKAFIRNHPLARRLLRDRSAVGHLPAPASLTIQVKPTKAGVAFKLVNFEFARP